MEIVFRAKVSHSEFGDTVSIETVSPVVDRPVTYSISVAPKLVRRMVKAIEAGAITKNPVVKTDGNGKTYVKFEVTVRGRCANADLKSLGF
jgi:hypothetical protein